MLTTQIKRNSKNIIWLGWLMLMFGLFLMAKPASAYDVVTDAGIVQTQGDDGPTAVSLQTAFVSTTTVNAILIFTAAFLLLTIATYIAYRHKKQQEEQLKREQIRTRRR